jgi:hypothetical protein
MFHLVLAGIWLGLAVFAFLQPGGQEWVIPNTSISIGWIALAFFAYNVIRWRSSRGPMQRPTTWQPRHDDGAKKPIDPALDFSDPRREDGA